jgi:acetyltransferase-like isoleucine patch superfamily enzyme
MVEHGMILGEYDSSKVGGLPPVYFWERKTSLDFRGDLRIDNMVTLGPWVKILTASHDFENGQLGTTVFKKCWLDFQCFIGGYSLLYNCHVKRYGVVACGSVVRNMTVEPYTMVEGNPARLIKRFIDGKWVRV